MALSYRVRLAAALLGGAALLQAPLALAQTAAPAAPAPAAPTPAAAPAAPSGPPSVNGQAITDQQIAVAAEDLGANLPQMTPDQQKAYIASYLIDLKLAADEAAKEGVVPSADLDQRLAYQREKILMEALLTKAARDATTEAAMRKVYDTTVSTIKPEEEVHARHILLPDQATAEKARARVTGGEDFAKVAGELSTDKGSSDGGDLGWFTRDRMVKEFADAAFALKPGEVSQPVHSQFGWHIIKLEGRRPKAPPAYEQVKPQIQAFLARQAQGQLVMRLRSGAKIVAPPAPEGGMPGGAPDGETAAPPPQ